MIIITIMIIIIIIAACWMPSALAWTPEASSTCRYVYNNN